MACPSVSLSLLFDFCTTPNQTQSNKQTMHQGSQTFNLGRVSLTYTGPGQFNHINDNPHEHARDNTSTRPGPPWSRT